MGDNGKSDETYLRQANDLLKTLPAKDVSSFVASLMADDPAVVKRFLRQFGPFDFDLEKNALLIDLEDAEYEYSEFWDGFIDRHHSSAYASAIRQIASAYLDAAIAREEYESALSLGFEVYLFITQVKTDSHRMFFDNLIDVLDDSWDAIFNAARTHKDEKLFRLLFNRLNDYRNSPDIWERVYSEIEYDCTYREQCEHIESYLVSRFRDVSSYALTIQRFADFKLESAIKRLKIREAADNRSGIQFNDFDQCKQDVVHWVVARVRCMEATGASYDERIAFAKDYLFERDVCLYFVDAAERAGDYAEAVRLVDACLDNAREKDELAPDWTLERAVALYEHEGEDAAVRNALEQLVVSGAARQDAPEWLRKLRGLYETDEWPARRDRLLSRVKADRYRWRYYVEEELFDRLMDEIEPKGVSALRGFEEFLAPRYPERVLVMYRKKLLGPREAEPPVGDTRNSYATFAGEVRHVRSIPGGDELADHIVTKVLELYPRRPALREELGRA